MVRDLFIGSRESRDQKESAKMMVKSLMAKRLVPFLSVYVWLRNQFNLCYNLISFIYRTLFGKEKVVADQQGGVVGISLQKKSDFAAAALCE